MELIDLAIVGSGPAGITAAIYAVRKNLKIRVFEAEDVGGQTSKALWVENYPGFSSINGQELMKKMSEHLKQFNVSIEVGKKVTDAKKVGKKFELVLNEKETIEAKAVLIATGTKHKKLDVKGEEKFYGKGVSYCAVCDGLFFKGKKVVVVGAGNSGATAALYFKEISQDVKLVEFLPEMRCDEFYKEKLEKEKIKVFLNHEVLEIFGNEKVEGIKVKNRESNEVKEIKADGVFIYVGLMPKNELGKKLGCKVDEKGFIAVNESMETSVEGVFAAGDITGKLAQTVVAAAQGAIAAVSAYGFLKHY